MPIALITLGIRVEQDVVAARQRARQISALLGFEPQDQARIATAVSEIARNAFRYAGGGEVEFSVEGERAQQSLAIVVRDRGPGIADLDRILAGRYRSATGMGLGISGARRLMDQCEVQTGRGGTRVTLKKSLPEGAPHVDAAAVAGLTRVLAARVAPTALDEVQQQNRELLRTLSELRERQDELLAVNRELEDTNRGVVALYAELADRAESLRRADETKTRFFSNMSHELRTPLNSIRALCSILLEQADGPLVREQETQVRFIAKAADDLAELVNDLLDLAKIEAGKVAVRPAQFTVDELFSALRGMLRPLLVSERVALLFQTTEPLPPLRTDDTKLSQILRNFISNALKYTEAGEIRVTARYLAEADEVAFAVADTGIGIATEDQELIFEEFEQVPNPLQARVQGTGLGLPLSRRLATVLGGRVSVESELGKGSTFCVVVPRCYREPAAEAPPAAEALRDEPRRGRSPHAGARLLVIDDDEAARYAVRRLADAAGCQVLEAADAQEGLRAATLMQPDLIVLDLDLPDRRGEDVLEQLAHDGETSAIPVVIATSEALTPSRRDALRAASAAAVFGKHELDRAAFDGVLAGLRPRR